MLLITLLLGLQIYALFYYLTIKYNFFYFFLKKYCSPLLFRKLYYDNILQI